jgi:hypothetical protein
VRCPRYGLSNNRIAGAQFRSKSRHQACLENECWDHRLALRAEDFVDGGVAACLDARLYLWAATLNLLDLAGFVRLCVRD